MLKRLVITGYKQHELGIFDDKHKGIGIIKKAIKNRLLPLIDEGLEWIIISGQLGVELWAAEVVIELKETYPHLKYAVITPFIDQDKNWNNKNQEMYRFILSRADYTNSLTKTGYEAPWQFVEKNKFFLRNSDGLLIVYDEENEGSPKYMKEFTERFMEKVEYQMFVITADELQVIVEDEAWQEWSEQ